jgi:hypothetical protein
MVSASAILAITTTPAQARTLSEDLLGELQVMRNVYSTSYAPAAWKKHYANYDLETEYSKALQSLQSKPTMSIQEARAILRDFVYAMKDYHVAVSFEATESAKLPFSVRGAGDKFFIVNIDREKLPESMFPFSVGDELVAFAGKPTLDAIVGLQAETPNNVPETDRSLAELQLTRRSAARGLTVPQGPVTIGVRPTGSAAVKNFELSWEYSPEKIHYRGDLSNSKPFRTTSQSGSQARSGIFNPQMSIPVLEGETAEDSHGMGVRKTFTPALGPKVWESADTDMFHAYIYKTPDRKLIGYVRIPSYGMKDNKAAAEEFSKIIGRFEQATDGLVIDQVNNPGGSVLYLYALASMLATEPLATPLHRVTITPSDVTEALAAIKLLEPVKTDEEAKKAMPDYGSEGFPVGYQSAQFVLNISRFIVSEWDAGRRFTNPTYIGGVNRINPAPTHYTKPILILVNSLDFSGGDFFPAILQDNKRVTVMGTRTAGAGGYVLRHTIPNNVGVAAFTCTGSIAERVNKDPIENLGVKPDIEYKLTENDYAKGYVDYVKAIQDAIGGLTK